MTPRSDFSATDPEALAVYTIRQFYTAHQISRGKFYKMVRAGEGPDMIVLGSRRLISFEAAARWRKKMERRNG